MRKARKTVNLLLITAVLLLGLLVIGLQANAVGFLPTESEIDVYLYNKYDIANYQVDLYIDTSGNWLPWNWLDGIDSGILSVLAFLFNVIYMIAVYIWYFIGFFVQQIYKLDLIDMLAEGIEGYVQDMAGFNGVMGDGLLNKFLIILIFATGAYLMWKGMVKRETGEAVSWIIKFMALFAFSLFFYTNTTLVMENSNSMVTEINTKVASVFVGGEQTADVSIREGLFETTVLNPYLLFQYGKTDVDSTQVNNLLSKKPGSDEREEVVKKEVKDNGNEYMSGWNGLFYRIVMGTIIFLVNLIIALVCLITATLSIYHQLVFLVLIFFAPFIFIYGMLPGKASVVTRWLEKLVYHLFMKVGVTLLFTIMFTFSSFVLNLAVTNGGYLIAVMLQAVIFVCIFFMRNKIFDLFTENRNKKGGPSVSDMYYLSRFGSHLLEGQEDGKGRKSKYPRLEAMDNPEEGLIELENDSDYYANGVSEESADLTIRGENVPEEKQGTLLKEYEYEGEKQGEIDLSDEYLIEKNPAVDEEASYVEPDAVKIYDEDGNLEYDSEVLLDETVEENVDVTGENDSLEIKDNIIEDDDKNVINEQELEMAKESDNIDSTESYNEFERQEYDAGMENKVVDERDMLYDRSSDTEESLENRQVREPMDSQESLQRMQELVPDENIHLSDNNIELEDSLYENDVNVKHSYDEQNVQIDSEMTDFNERREDI